MRKRLLLITLAVVLLVLGINIFTRGGYFSGKVEGYLLEQTRSAIGFDTGMKRLVFNFFPAYIDLEEPYIRGWDKDNAKRMLSAQRVRVYFSLGALVNKRVSISRIQVYEPSVELIRLTSGGLNIDLLKDRINELIKKKPAGGAVKTEVGEVVLFDARVTYSDPASRLFVVVGKGGVDLRAREGGQYWAGFRLKDLVARRAGLPAQHIRLEGDALWKAGTVTLMALKLESEGTKVDATGRVSLSKTPVFDLKLSSRINLDLLDRLALWKNGPSGEADINGSVKGTYPDFKGSGRLALKKVVYAGVKLDDLESKIDFDKGALDMPEIKSRLLGGTIKGDARMEMGGDAPRWRSSWTFKDIVSGEYTEGRKDLSFIPWQTVSGRIEISGVGFSTSGIEASGDVETARYEKPHQARSVSRELSIIKAVRARFRLKAKTVTVDAGTVSTKASTVNFTGTVGLDGQSDLALKGRSNDIGEISTLIGYSDLKGKLDLTGYVKGDITEPVIFGKAQITDAVAHGVPFASAYGDVKLSGWQLAFNDFMINQDHGSFLLNGKILFKGEGAAFNDPYFIAKLGVRNVNARRITAIFYQDIPVNLVANGDISFSGNTRRFKGEAHLSTGAGDVYGQPLDKGEVNAVLSEKDISFPKVVAVRGRDVVTASGGIGFDGTFHGKAVSARFDLSNFGVLTKTGVPVKGSASLSVTGGGRFDNPDIKANVSTFKLGYQDVDLGAGSVSAHMKGSVMTLGGTLLDGKVAIDGFMGLSAPYRWRGRLTFNEGRFEPFLKLVYKDLPEDVSLVSTGVFTGEGALNDPSKTAMTVDFTRVSATIWGRRLENEGNISLALADGRLDVKRLRLKGDSVFMEVSGGAAGMEQVDVTVKAKAQLDIFKQLVKDNVDYIDGEGQAELRIKGVLKGPGFSGYVRLANAGVKFRDLNQRFDRIQAEIKFEGDSFTLSRLESEFGGGKVTASGKGNLKGYSIDGFSFDIAAAGVRVKYPEGLASTVDADLRFEGVEKQRSISGDLTLKRGRYAERIDWKSWLVSFQQKREEISAGRPGELGNTALNLHITGADSIKIDNNVAKIPVSTDLYVKGTINDPVILGRLEATSGFVYFRNNEFRLLNGVAEFADPRKLNPIIDLQAETKVKDYQIQLTLSGSVDRIKVSLNSDPPLEDADIITLLTLGRTTEALKGHESAITTGEATSFVTGQIQDAVESRMRRITGFDRFQVDPYLTSSGVSSGPRLTIGKTLFSDKVIMTYSSNLGTSEEQFVKLEYILSKNLSMVGERDELGHFGADLKFRFEFK